MKCQKKTAKPTKLTGVGVKMKAIVHRLLPLIQKAKLFEVIDLPRLRLLKKVPSRQPKTTKCY